MLFVERVDHGDTKIDIDEVMLEGRLGSKSFVQILDFGSRIVVHHDNRSSGSTSTLVSL